MPTAHAEKMSELILKLFDLCHEREACFVAKFNLRISEFRCLYLLHKNDHVAVKELADAMNNTPGRLSKIIDSLFKLDLINRTESNNDRRIKIISLTEKGKNLVNVMKEEYDNLNVQILSEIRDLSNTQIIHAITQLVAAMTCWKNKYHK